MNELSEIQNAVLKASADGSLNRIANLADGIDQTDAVNVRQLQMAARPYKSYVALITQTGTSAPTAVELENTIGAISFSYIITGNYRAVSAGLFTLNKTTCMIAQSNSQGTGLNYCYLLDSTSDEDSIVIQSKAVDMDTGVDSRLMADVIEIRVYN